MQRSRTLRARAGDLWRRLRWFGRRRHCVLCGSSLRSFLPHGRPPRPQAVCPVCQSRERHRLAWLYLSRHVLTSERSRRVLHIAPEPVIARRLVAHPGVDYVSGDLRASSGLRFDVQHLPFRDHSFDLVYCSHVLNMVDDDVAALREIGRVLKRDGLALVQVPLSAEPTTLAATKAWDGARRLAVFGDVSMSHRHGVDVLDRFATSGLRIARVDFAGEFERGAFERLGSIREDLLVARRADVATVPSTPIPARSDA